MGRGQGARRIAQLLGAHAKQHIGEARGISSSSSGGPARSGLGAGRGPATPTNHQQTRTSAQVAVQQATQQLTKVVVPAVKTDLYGAVSVVAEGEKVEPGVFKNIDGHRFDDGRYTQFMEEISKFIPKERQYTDPVRTFAYGTDASFYRLNPKLVVKVHNEEEIRRIMPIAERLKVPITFRAAGTSLSGQAITDSVLLKLSHTGKNFRNYTVHVSIVKGLEGGLRGRALGYGRRGQHWFGGDRVGGRGGLACRARMTHGQRQPPCVHLKHNMGNRCRCPLTMLLVHDPGTR